MCETFSMWMDWNLGFRSLRVTSTFAPLHTCGVKIRIFAGELCCTGTPWKRILWPFSRGRILVPEHSQHATIFHSKMSETIISGILIGFHFFIMYVLFCCLVCLLWPSWWYCMHTHTHTYTYIHIHASHASFVSHMYPQNQIGLRYSRNLGSSFVALIMCRRWP